MAFTNERTNFTFTTNYDSVDLSLFSSQLPHVERSANGSVRLEWHSAGQAYCYRGIHPDFWTVQVLGRVNGTVFNHFLHSYLEPFNGTWPYYEMFNVKHRHADTYYLKSRECFDFVVGGIAALNAAGGALHGELKRNLVTFYADTVPQLVNMSDSATHAKVVEFYEVLTLKWGHVHNFFELIKVLFEVADGSEFFLHAGDRYYQFELEWPVIDIAYTSVKF